MANEINGSRILVYASPDGTTFVPLAAQRGGSRTRNRNAIDVSSKADDAQRVINGRYSSTVSVDGLWILSDAALTMLESAVQNGDPVYLRLYIDGVAKEEAEAVCTDLTENYPDQDVTTYTAAFTVSGKWATV